MPVLKVKKNGVWEDVMGGSSSSSMNGGNADTVDGKHASDFASASDVDDLKEKVGDTSVEQQINDAISNAGISSSDIVIVQIDTDTNTASMTYTEIFNCMNKGKVVFACESFPSDESAPQGNIIYMYESTSFSGPVAGMGINASFININATDTGVISKRVYIDGSGNVAHKSNEYEPSDSNVVIVHIDETTNTASMTYDDIIDCMDQGKAVFAYSGKSRTIYIYKGTAFSFGSTDTSNRVIFENIAVANSVTIIASNVHIDNSGNVTHETIEYEPSVDTSDLDIAPDLSKATGTLAIANGGTGATTADGARTNLETVRCKINNSQVSSKVGETYLFQINMLPGFYGDDRCTETGEPMWLSLQMPSYYDDDGGIHYAYAGYGVNCPAMFFVMTARENRVVVLDIISNKLLVSQLGEDGKTFTTTVTDFGENIK